MLENNIPGTESMVDFDGAKGEAFVGLNLLQLNVNQADGPFRIVEIVTKDFGTAKKPNPLPVYHTMKGTTPVQMPISASFLTKASEANLAVGDVILVKRGENFKSAEFGTENCKSYLLKVTARAPRESIAPTTKPPTGKQ